MLVGTVLLQHEFNSWKTTPLWKEKLQHLEKTFTEKAIKITSYIYEDDKKNKKNNAKNEKKEADDNTHAERLLLNHGYLREAIYTENTTYLESDTVKKILTKSFYGTESVHGKTV
ncbi:Hypothetical predicted protein [Mytilus galloprovincialis]|uniref:Uncharacterized protein n=1 Tax=Mytilus galloprovincialis TaxID=29158 RepID=A0A8B6HHH7_MYTGA|nr:Hypothetical predicted protein [Mytilus galloprovincialis]